MATKMLGVERRDLMRASFRKFVTTESQDDWYLHRQAVFSTKTTQVCEIRTRSAIWELAVYSSGEYFGRDRKESCCRTALVDITERKRAEDEREQLLAREQAARKKMEATTQAKDRFSAMVSHELRTPLPPILGWVAVLRPRIAKDVGVASALDGIERNPRKQARLVEDLLDVSGSLTGKMRLRFMPVELPEIVNARVETVRPIAEKTQITIQMQLGKNASMASGDRDRLQQVIWNLRTNAVKFTKWRTDKGTTLAYRLEHTSRCKRHWPGNSDGLHAVCLRCIPSGRPHPDEKPGRTRVGPGNRTPHR